MSQNKNRAKPQNKQPSTPKTNDETATSEDPTSSDQTTTQVQDAPGDGEAQDGVSTPDQDQDDAGTPTDTPEAEEEAPAGEDGNDRNKPVDANTANIQWTGVPEESAPEGRILGPDDELSFDGEEIGNTVVVKEDVYRKVFARGARRPSYVMLYRKGTQVPVTSVQRNQAAAAEDTEKNEG